MNNYFTFTLWPYPHPPIAPPAFRLLSLSLSKYNMAATQNGHTNGVNGHAHSPEAAPFKRFSTIPAAMDIPVSSGDVEEAVEVDLEDLMDDPTELCTLLENENVAKNYWMTIALAYAKQQKLHHAVDILTKGLGALSRARPEDKLTLLACLCWLHLWQCRDAPRLKPGSSCLCLLLIFRTH